MRKLSPAAFALMLAVALCQPASSQSLKGKFVGTTLSPEPVGLTSDVDALMAVEAIKTPLQTQVTLYEYGESLRKASVALDKASQLPNPSGIEPLKAALNSHYLALDFWNECLLLRNDFFCDENRPAVAEVLRRYPKPLRIETISRTSVVEALRRSPQPWVATRVRATLREVVEYIPANEQRKVLRLLWTQADVDAKQAAIALGMPAPRPR